MEKLRREKENERLRAEKKLMLLSADAEEKRVKKVKFEEGL